MDYQKIYEALRLIHDTCEEVGDCDVCPMNNDGKYGIMSKDPANWAVQVPEIRLLK